MGISKILIFVAVGVLGYMAYRRVQRYLDGRADGAKVRKGADGRVLNEMDKCDVCGTYVAAGVGRCARADCPR
jgi:hypothetical protein